MPRVIIAALVASSILAAVTRSYAQPSDRVAYLIDYASRTLDLVDLEHGTVALGLEPVGDVPNQIEVRGTTAFVVNSAPEQLQIIDLAGPTTTAIVPFDPGTNPWAVELVGDRAYVSLWGSDQVAVVDLTNLTVVHTIDVGVAPEGMCLAGDEIYVANSGFVQFGVYDPGTVSVIDTGTNVILATIPVGLNSQWCATDAEGEVHVVCSDLYGANNGRVFILDPLSHAAIDSLWVGGFPGPIAIGPDGTGWMVEYGAGLLAIDTAGHTVLHDVNDPVSAGGIGALGLDVDQAGRVHVALSADQLLTVVAPDGTLSSSYAVGPGPQDVALYEAAPVPVLVAGFEAWRREGKVELRWRVPGDDLVGCHVERRRDESGSAFVRLTTSWITGEYGVYAYVDAAPGPGELVYRLTGVAFDESRVPLGQFRVAAQGPAGTAVAPGATALAIAAWPNPVAAAPGQSMTIEVTAAGGERTAEVVVFTSDGRAIRSLHRGALAPGSTRLGWDGRDARGLPVPSGAYFLRVIGEHGARSLKAILLR